MKRQNTIGKKRRYFYFVALYLEYEENSYPFYPDFAITGVQEDN